MIVVAPDIGGVGAINPTLLKGATPQLIVSTNKDTTTSCSFGLPAFAAQARIPEMSQTPLSTLSWGGFCMVGLTGDFIAGLQSFAP